MSIESLLGVRSNAGSTAGRRSVSFSFLFFSDTRPELSSWEKYEFVRDLTLFGDREGFEAVYLPERHFNEFGALFPNSAIMAAYLIPQTRRIRFRTAGVSLPLHHPAEVVEWWAMNDVLSGGRVDLGFGSGWSRADFVFAPENYDDRRKIMEERISAVQRLWRGEAVTFRGPDGSEVPVTVHPRPIQKELKIWILVAQNEESFAYAGRNGYNVFTMLYGYDFEALRPKIDRYRMARREAGYDPQTGVVSLMLHTFIGASAEAVQPLVEEPLRVYIRSAMNSHLDSRASRGDAAAAASDRIQILEYAYQRYRRTSALLGSVHEGIQVVEHAIDSGVNEIACLLDFGVDYTAVRDSLPNLRRMAAYFSE
jgi:natural product biosynthesis luciferase-like monooxygenase protein